MEFPESVGAEFDTLNLFLVLANRKRGCGRRKPACPPAERNDAAEEVMSGGSKKGGEDDGSESVHASSLLRSPAASTTRTLPLCPA